jgi:HPt (histidine-containing phosphotransfer) domain-containing protein
MEGDYQTVYARLSKNERIIKKFVLKFLEDGSYDLLVRSLEEKNYREAFRAAHTMKGICQNLSFTKLYNSVNELAETLRPEDADVQKAGEQFLDVERDYKQTVEAIRTLQAEG